MKLICCADIHNGVPGKLKDTIWSMDVIRRYAKKNNIKYVLILGDLFHDRQNIGIDVMNAVHSKLKQSKEDGQTWIVFCGNHDLFLKNSWDINSLVPLESVIKVINGIDTIEISEQRFTILPFIHYESEYMKQLNSIKYVKNDILLTHIGVNNATLNECFLLKHWSTVNFEDTPYDLVFTGHFHCHQQLGKVWYPGSPIPFRFDEGVVEHGFIEFDIDTREVKFIKIFEIYKELGLDYKPPDYLNIIDKDLPTYLHLLDGNNVKISLSRDYTVNEMNKLKDILKKKGAQSIRWTLFKNKISEVHQNTTESVSLNTPDTLFRSWINIDKPKLDFEKLLQWHDQVIKAAQDRIVVEIEDDE